MTPGLEQLAELMRDLFDEYEGPITEKTSPQDIPQWDSLGHVQLVVLVEKTFGVKFSSDEIEGLKSAGQILDAIAKRG